MILLAFANLHVLMLPAQSIHRDVSLAGIDPIPSSTSGILSSRQLDQWERRGLHNHLQVEKRLINYKM